MRVKKMIKKGCEAYLAYVKDMDQVEQKLEDVPIVQEFFNVFPKELPSLPPK